ncbi:uncharacterized protein AAEQ78_018559 [Lycaon pictus]
MLGRLRSSSPDSRGGIPGWIPTHRPLTLAPASGPAGAELTAQLWRLLPGDTSPAQPPPPGKQQPRASRDLRQSLRASRPSSQTTSHLQERIQPPWVNSPRLRASFTRFPPELHTAPFKLGPPSHKSPSPYSGSLSSLGNPVLREGVPRSAEHAPAPTQRGPYLLPRVPLPSHIPVRRSGGLETVEPRVRGLGTPHSGCSGFRAGLGTPPKPGRSRRCPRSLRCRRRRGACSSSPCERPASCQCAGATARPRGRTGTSQAGRSDGNKGQWRGAGAPGTRGSGPWRSPIAMQPGGRAPVEAPWNRAAAPSAGRWDHRRKRPCLPWKMSQSQLKFDPSYGSTIPPNLDLQPCLRLIFPNVCWTAPPGSPALLI